MKTRHSWALLAILTTGCAGPPPPRQAAPAPTRWVRVDGRPADPRLLSQATAICQEEAARGVIPTQATLTYAISLAAVLNGCMARHGYIPDRSG